MEKGLNTPTIIIIFGGTGDLSQKKLIPALWHLFMQKRLPNRLSVIGFSRRGLSSEEFRKFAWEAVKKRSIAKIKDEEFSPASPSQGGHFLESFSYHIGTFEDTEAFRSLADAITETESSWGICANKLFYLAVPPTRHCVEGRDGDD